jgi:hypothetical protein
MIRRKTQEKAPRSRVVTAHSSFPAPLSPHWAFVVQLREGTALTATQMHGRIEHIVSGQATMFCSLEELRTFIEQVLSQRDENPP